MHTYFKSPGILFMLFLLLMPACNIRDFGDTNENPNATSTPITSALLANAITQLGRTPIIPGYYCQYFSQTQYTDESRYRVIPFGFFDYRGIFRHARCTQDALHCRKLRDCCRGLIDRSTQRSNDRQD